MGSCLNRLFYGGDKKSTEYTGKVHVSNRRKTYPPRADMVSSFFLQDQRNAPSNISIHIQQETACLVSNRPDEDYSKKLIINYQVNGLDKGDYKDLTSQAATSRSATRRRKRNADFQIRTKAKSTFQKPIDVVKIEEQVFSSLHRSGSKQTIKHSKEDLQAFDNDLEKVLNLINIKLSHALIEQNQDQYYQADDSQEHYEPLKEKQLPAKIQWKASEVIGQGSFGKVLFGINIDTGQQMAVKQVELRGVSKNDPRVKALEVEINLLSKFENKNIVSYYGMERTDKDINIFLEYVGGGSLSALIKRFGAFDENLIKVYMKQILNGLHYLHKHGIMHRDIKGANVLVEKSGICKLADFGSGKQFHGMIQQDQCGSLCGTPNWMAPEVMEQDQYGRKADIWSVGCTMIEMATAKPPWGIFSNPLTALFQIASKKSSPPLPDNLSDSAKDFLSICFQLDPKNRWTAKKLLNHAWLQPTVEGRPRNNSKLSVGSMNRSRASSQGQQIIIPRKPSNIDVKRMKEGDTDFIGSSQIKEYTSPMIYNSNTDYMDTILDTFGKSQVLNSHKFSKFYPKSPITPEKTSDASLKLTEASGPGTQIFCNQLQLDHNYNILQSFDVEAKPSISNQVRHTTSLLTPEEQKGEGLYLGQGQNISPTQYNKKSPHILFSHISEDHISQEQETEQVQFENEPEQIQIEYQDKQISDSEEDQIQQQILIQEVQQKNNFKNLKLSLTDSENPICRIKKLKSIVEFEKIDQFTSSDDD